MIIDILTIIGLTLIITTSKLFKPFREWLFKKNRFLSGIIDCPMCSGFWIGLTFYFLPNEITIDFEVINIKLFFIIFVKQIIAYASISSISCEIVHRIIEKLKLK